MKKGHIIAIVAIAIAIAMLISTAGDASRYVNFDEAKTLAENGNNTKIHVVGTLKKNPQGDILEMNYNPAQDPNLFTFTLVDDQNREERVIFRNPKPADFERSEQVVVVGGFKNGHFVADKILMKCPSKYQENTLEVKEAEAKS